MALLQIVNAKYFQFEKGPSLYGNTTNHCKYDIKISVYSLLVLLLLGLVASCIVRVALWNCRFNVLMVSNSNVTVFPTIFDYHQNLVDMYIQVTME